MLNEFELKTELWPPAEMRKKRVRPATAIKVTHRPTGLCVIERTKRSTYENKYHAIKQLEIEVNKYYEDMRDE